MSEVLAAVAIGVGGGVATFVAIQQVAALIRERRNAIRATTLWEEEARRCRAERVDKTESGA